MSLERVATSRMGHSQRGMIRLGVARVGPTDPSYSGQSGRKGKVRGALRSCCRPQKEHRGARGGFGGSPEGKAGEWSAHAEPYGRINLNNFAHRFAPKISVRPRAK
jgi:hypothetical protein